MVGSRVLFPLESMPQELRVELDTATMGDAWLLFGRLDGVRPRNEVVIAVTGDGETCVLNAGLVFRLPTQEETLEEARAAAERQIAAGDAALAAAPGDEDLATGGTERGVGAALPEEEVHETDSRVGVQRVEYKASEGWEQSELHAREALARREAARRAARAPPRVKHAGMDAVLPVGTTHADILGEKVPIAPDTSEGMAKHVATRVSPGYDLVRVGNFTPKMRRRARLR
eukprot:3635714-Prymnesium_polylepis.1